MRVFDVLVVYWSPDAPRRNLDTKGAFEVSETSPPSLAPKQMASAVNHLSQDTRAFLHGAKALSLSSARKRSRQSTLHPSVRQPAQWQLPGCNSSLTPAKGTDKKVTKRLVARRCSRQQGTKASLSLSWCTCSLIKSRTWGAS